MRTEDQNVHRALITLKLVLFILCHLISMLNLGFEAAMHKAVASDIEPSGRALPKEPFSRLEPHIGDSLSQSSAFGLVKTGKDFGLSQFFWSKHETGLKSA